jgi:hypothetical protein
LIPLFVYLAVSFLEAVPLFVSRSHGAVRVERGVAAGTWLRARMR